jgi:hypothetical protein
VERANQELKETILNLIKNQKDDSSREIFKRISGVRDLVLKRFDFLDLSSMIFFSPSFGVLLVAAFPRMKFCGKYETKIMRKEIYQIVIIIFKLALKF